MMHFHAEEPELVDDQGHQDVRRDGQTSERPGTDLVDEEQASNDRK